MQKSIFTFTVVLLLSACSVPNEQSETPPANLLPADTFCQILADFALAESAANMNIENVPNYRLDTVYAFDPIRENKVRRSQYDSTLTYYSEHPDQFKKIYENVLVLLSEMQTQRDSLHASPPVK